MTIQMVCCRYIKAHGKNNYSKPAGQTTGMNKMTAGKKKKCKRYKTGY